MLTKEKLQEYKRNEEKKREFVQQQMIKKFPYYRAWNKLDEKLTEWFENPKSNPKQKLLLLRLRNCALLLRAQIENNLPESKLFAFEHFNSVIQGLESEKKNLKAEILKLKKENIILLEKNETQAKTIKSLSAEVEYYEKEK